MTTHTIDYTTSKQFRTLIETTLSKYGKLNDTTINFILDSKYDDITGLELYCQGFTHKSIHEEENYEYESNHFSRNSSCKAGINEKGQTTEINVYSPVIKTETKMAVWTIYPHSQTLYFTFISVPF